MRLLFIRHTSVDVPKGICYGQTDVSVTGKFLEEAASIKNALSKYDIDKAYTSPLSRCVKLAEACGFNNAIHDNRLMEMNFGAWEMKRYDEISDPRLQQWFDDYINVRATEGESFIDQRKRFISFIESLQPKNNTTIAIFTHAGIIVHAMVLYLHYSIDEAFSRQPSFGSILEVNL